MDQVVTLTVPTAYQSGCRKHRVLEVVGIFVSA